MKDAKPITNLAAGLIADINDQTIKREYRKQYRANEEISLTADFVYQSTFAGLEHQVLFGGDYHDVTTDYDYFLSRYEAHGVQNLNIFELNYGITDPSTYLLFDMNRDGVDNAKYSFYVQDMINLNEQWVLMLGARFDDFEETNKETDTKYSDNDVSYRGGITYKVDDTLSLYGNYSESFNPVSANDFDESESALKPTTGNQIEFGAKKEWLGGRIFTTLAFYQIDKENMVQANPDYIDEVETPDISPLNNFGLIESEGVELVLVGDISEQLSLTANYAYNNTTIVEGENSNISANGSFVNAPKHQAGVWFRYSLEHLNSAIAMGADYVSEQWSFGGQRVKPYTVFDASWTTRWDDMLLSINVNNIFDREYAVSGFSERNGHFPGEPREIIAQLTYSF